MAVQPQPGKKKRPGKAGSWQACTRVNSAMVKQRVKEGERSCFSCQLCLLSFITAIGRNEEDRDTSIGFRGNTNIECRCFYKGTYEMCAV